MEHTTNSTFTGTIHQLLQHCARLNLDDLDSQIEHEDAIEETMRLTNSNRQDAVAMVEEAQLSLLQDAINDLIKDGSIEMSLDKNGEPIYHNVEKPKRKRKK